MDPWVYQELAAIRRELAALRAVTRTSYDTLFASRPPTDHFNQPTLETSWAWAGGVFGGTPSTVNLTDLPGHLCVNNATGSRFFLYRSGSWGSGAGISARILPSGNHTTGLRLDDGTDNNYFEWYVTTGTAAGSKALVTRTRSGGGAVTTTTRVDNLPVHPVTVGLVAGATWSCMYSLEPHCLLVSSPDRSGLIVASPLATVTYTRAGILHENLVSTGSINQRSIVDWFYTT